jgi:RNA polymerase-binding protein DksA
VISASLSYDADESYFSTGVFLLPMLHGCKNTSCNKQRIVFQMPRKLYLINSFSRGNTTVNKKSKPKKAAKPPQPAKREKAEKVQPRHAEASRKLTKKDLQRFKERLLTEKKRVLEEVGDIQHENLKTSIADQSGENSRYSYHLGDTASLAYGREFSMGLAERQQKYLEQIDEALQRIQEGSYGICLVTGEPIPVERLEEVPVAKYSVKGKEILEKRKQKGVS